MSLTKANCAQRVLCSDDGVALKPHSLQNIRHHQFSTILLCSTTHRSLYRLSILVAFNHSHTREDTQHIDIVCVFRPSHSLLSDCVYMTSDGCWHLFAFARNPSTISRSNTHNKTRKIYQLESCGIWCDTQQTKSKVKTQKYAKLNVSRLAFQRRTK